MFLGLLLGDKNGLLVGWLTEVMDLRKGMVWWAGRTLPGCWLSQWLIESINDVDSAAVFAVRPEWIIESWISLKLRCWSHALVYLHVCALITPGWLVIHDIQPRNVSDQQHFRYKTLILLRPWWICQFIQINFKPEFCWIKMVNFINNLFCEH